MEKNKLLVVEDNEVNLKLYMYMLKTIDAEILIARTGVEALEVIEKFKPSVIILDIQIPEIDGLEVARRVRKNLELKDITIIAVTAYSMVGDKEKILQSGCNYYVSKPIDTRKFPIIIERLLKGEQLDI